MPLLVMPFRPSWIQISLPVVASSATSDVPLRPRPYSTSWAKTGLNCRGVRIEPGHLELADVGLRDLVRSLKFELSAPGSVLVFRWAAGAASATTNRRATANARVALGPRPRAAKESAAPVPGVGLAPEAAWASSTKFTNRDIDGSSRFVGGESLRRRLSGQRRRGQAIFRVLGQRRGCAGAVLALQSPGQTPRPRAMRCRWTPSSGRIRIACQSAISGAALCRSSHAAVASRDERRSRHPILRGEHPAYDLIRPPPQLSSRVCNTQHPVPAAIFTMVDWGVRNPDAPAR